ncbi:MAG: HEAT repeat domain-containing protein [Ktedonobacteraceae bacterium]
MIDERYTNPPDNRMTTPMNRHSTSSHTGERGKILVRSLLVGILFTLLLTCIELGLFWLINPNHLLGTGVAHQLPTLLALPVHFPVLWLIPVIELAGTTVAAFMATRPLALRAYLRDMQREQELYRGAHTSLAAFANVYHTPVTYYPHTTDVSNSNVQTQAQVVSLLNVLQQQESNLLLLGDAGAGKTLALHLYLTAIARQGWTRVRSRATIPVYIPLQDYSAFLLTAVKESASNSGNASNPDEVTERATLLDFLYETNLPGMHHLRPHLNSLLKQGRLELLCDGLEEVASAYRVQVSRQLANLMMITQDRFVIAARTADYAEAQQLVDLVDGGFAARAIIFPLSSQAMRECIEQYIEVQDNGWHYTAGQLMQIITTTRLRYLCSNPLLLFTLLEMIQATTIDRAKVLDTRGRLLQAYVMQLITHEQSQPHWNTGTPPASKDLVRFLSAVACAARWSGSFNAIQLVSQSGHVQPGIVHANDEIVAGSLLAWLDEHPAHSAFSLEQLPQSFDQQSVALMLRFAQSAALIDINAEGILSFRHEMIAAYFCAEYFQALDSVGSAGSANNVNSKRSIPTSSVTQQFLSGVEQWSEVIALWAGLLDNPTELAENFIALGLLDGHTGPRQNRLSALALSLICSGAAWRLPQTEATHFTQDMQLPTRVVDSMTIVVRNAPAREQLAQLFTLCAEEGGQEIYRSLLPLVMVDGIEEFLLLIDGTIVTDLLFTQLIETVDIFAYDAYVRRLCRVLGMLGSSVVDRASELSQHAPSRSLRLQAAAINILGSTHDASAVAPLIARLSDSEPSVVERTIHALIRLGPSLTLQAISSVLENTADSKQAHRAALTILERFLSDKTTKNLAAIKPGTTLVEPQAQSLNNVRILHTIIATLAAPYASEPVTQQQSKAILIRLGQQDSAAISLVDIQPDAQLTSIPSVLIGLLTRYLSSNDDTMVRNAIQVLVQIGDNAVPTLLEQFNLQSSQLPEIVRVHMVEVLRMIHDPRALPTILRLLADSSLLVQQQVALALEAYQPDSITGLIDIVVVGDNDMVAEKAAHLLGDMGTPTVEPIMQSLSHLTPGVSSRLDARRIRLLVYILERIHDARAIPVLVRVLATAQAAQPAQPEPLLAVAVIHTLSQFQDEQVVPPLIATLEQSNPQIYEEAIAALSHLGDLAFQPLIAALDVGQETVATPRIRRAILGMNPFPAERLITALQQSDRAIHRTFQVQQILAILRAQGADAAQVMVNHLFDNDSRLRDYTRRVLSEMDAAIVVPALLEALDHEAWRGGLAELLLNYPEAISPLVALLGDMDRCDAALAILPRYGALVLPALISALDNANLVIQEQTQGIITTLVYQDVSVLSQVVRLFATALPLRAHEALLEVLTNELADVSIPALLDGLEDAHLIEDVSIALARLVNKRSAQPEVIQGLLDALHNEERRRGAETALIKIGGLAVQPVGALITDPDSEVAVAAQHVLGAIGVPALSFIWAAHGDTSNRPRREAAMSVFHGMPTDVIKDALVQLLSSELPDDMSMALSLLVERIHDESTLSPENQEMVPTLLEYVQIHEGERISMRIAALLVLLGGASVVNHIIQILYNLPEEYMYPEQLLAILFFLRRESENALAGLLNDPHAPTPLRAEAIALLGMMGRSKDVVDYAQSLSNYGLAAGRNNILYADQLTIALRALGSLLASGNWDITTLLDMRRNYREGTPQHELYSVLLGWRYEPELANLENTIQNERDSHRRELMALTARIVSDQDQIADLENQLIQIREEHGQRSDELYQTTQEREAIRGRLDQSTREKHALQDQIAQLQSKNLQLVREIEAWRASQGQ